MQHSELKYVDGDLVKNADYKRPAPQPAGLSETDKIWKALADAKLVAIPADVKAKLDKAN